MDKNSAAFVDQLAEIQTLLPLGCPSVAEPPGGAEVWPLDRDRFRQKNILRSWTVQNSTLHEYIIEVPGHPLGLYLGSCADKMQLFYALQV